MASIRSQAEIYYDNYASLYPGQGGRYITTSNSGASNCTLGMWVDPIIERARTQVKINAAASATELCTVDSSLQKFAYSMSSLKGAIGIAYCVDSSGFAGVGSADSTGTCNSNN